MSPHSLEPSTTVKVPAVRPNGDETHLESAC